MNIWNMRVNKHQCAVLSLSLSLSLWRFVNSTVSYPISLAQQVRVRGSGWERVDKKEGDREMERGRDRERGFLSKSKSSSRASLKWFINIITTNGGYINSIWISLSSVVILYCVSGTVRVCVWVANAQPTTTKLAAKYNYPEARIVI